MSNVNPAPAVYSTTNQTEKDNTALHTAVFVGRFKRGVLNKPILITKENIRKRLGYDRKNKAYMALLECVSTCDNHVYVKRIRGLITLDDHQQYTLTIDNFDGTWLYGSTNGCGNTINIYGYYSVNGESAPTETLIGEIDSCSEGVWAKTFNGLFNDRVIFDPLIAKMFDANGNIIAVSEPYYRADEPEQLLQLDRYASYLWCTQLVQPLPDFISVSINIDDVSYPVDIATQCIDIPKQYPEYVSAYGNVFLVNVDPDLLPTAVGVYQLSITYTTADDITQTTNSVDYVVEQVQPPPPPPLIDAVLESITLDRNIVKIDEPITATITFTKPVTNLYIDNFRFISPAINFKPTNTQDGTDYQGSNADWCMISNVSRVNDRTFTVLISTSDVGVGLQAFGLKIKIDLSLSEVRDTGSNNVLSGVLNSNAFNILTSENYFEFVESSSSNVSIRVAIDGKTNNNNLVSLYFAGAYDGTGSIRNAYFINDVDTMLPVHYDINNGYDDGVTVFTGTALQVLDFARNGNTYNRLYYSNDLEAYCSNQVFTMAYPKPSDATVTLSYNLQDGLSITVINAPPTATYIKLYAILSTGEMKRFINLSNVNSIVMPDYSQYFNAGDTFSVFAVLSGNNVAIPTTDAINFGYTALSNQITVT